MYAIEQKNMNLFEHFAQKEYTTVASVYDEEAGSCPLFSGNFINFGFWENIDLSEHHDISAEDRLNSQKALYRYIGQTAAITPHDHVLEVGSGLGAGALLIAQEFKPASMTGVDASEHQVSNAKKKQGNTVSFCRGTAENLPFESNSFDVIMSIEAAQHFQSIEQFYEQAYRVLIPQGRIIVTTFFATHQAAIEPLKNLIPSIDNDVNKVTDIAENVNFLSKKGFINITVTSIGNNVFYGFDRYTAQTPLFETHWTREWLKAYNTHLLDYYVITAQKP